MNLGRVAREAPSCGGSCRPRRRPCSRQRHLIKTLAPDAIRRRALARELDEELAITVNPRDAAPAAFASQAESDRHLLLLLYVVRRWTGEPCAHAATALAWHRLDAVEQLAMPPADLPLLLALARLL